MWIGLTGGSSYWRFLNPACWWLKMSTGRSRHPVHSAPGGARTAGDCPATEKAGAGHHRILPFRRVHRGRVEAAARPQTELKVRLEASTIAMSRFAIRFPYFIIVSCLMTAVVGMTSLVRMPVDLFPNINIPVVVVATFYSGMPPEQIEADITGRFERFFTLGSGIEHIESRSLPGVSLIKVYFQPGTDSDSAVTTISNLAMANLRRLPPGTLLP